MVRSILLRGFDQEMANRVGDYMKEGGVQFLRGYNIVKVRLLVLCKRSDTIFLNTVPEGI